VAQSTEEELSKPERTHARTELWILAAVAGSAIVGVCVLAVALALILGKGSFIQVNPTISATLPASAPAAPASALTAPQRYSAPADPLAQRSSAQDRVQPALPGVLASPTPQSGRRGAELVRADSAAPPSPAFPPATRVPTQPLQRVQSAAGAYAGNRALPMPPVPHSVEEAARTGAGIASGSQPQRAPMGSAAAALQAMSQASGQEAPFRSPASSARPAAPAAAPATVPVAAAPSPAAPAATVPAAAAATALAVTPAAPRAPQAVQPSPQPMAAAEPSANAEPTVAVVTNIPFATEAPTLGGAQSTSSAAAAAAAPALAKGDTLFAGGLGQGSLADLRVVRARCTSDYAGQAAPKGNRYFVADLLVTNKASAPLSVDSSSYDLRDADGNSYMANPESDPSQVPPPVKNGASAPMSVNFLVPDDVNLKSLALVLPSETDLVPLLKQ
jgi:hypothetical protein